MISPIRANPRGLGLIRIFGVIQMKAFLKFIAMFLAPVAAFAEVPAAVTTAIGSAGTDSIVVAGAVLAVIVGIFAVKLMRKAL